MVCDVKGNLSVERGHVQNSSLVELLASRGGDSEHRSADPLQYGGTSG